MTFATTTGLVLASGSRYRKALLVQLGIAFEIASPDIDETSHPDERPKALARRLATEKAQAVAHRFPRGIIIGSDQVATLDDNLAFSKPESHAAAVAQLTQLSGRTVSFHTAVTVLNAATGSLRGALVSTEVSYRELTPEIIEAYLRRDQPYDCAGSARIESLGIALVRRVRSDDPSALLGLPLIALVDLLALEGITPFTHDG
jgi:septum formation protein